MRNHGRNWVIRAGIAFTCAVAFVLSGCSAFTSDKDPIELEFWYSSASKSGQILRELVNRFNQSHEGKIKVTALYQGKPTTLIGKLANSVQSGHYPDVVQMNDTNTVYMRDTGIALSAQKLNALYGNKLNEDDLIPAMRNYYTLDGELWSIPFYTAIPLLYLNNDIVSQAGLDLKNPPKTSDEVFKWAEQIHAKTGKAGLTGYIDPWYFEQFTASEGIVYCTPGNGLRETANDFTLTDPRQLKIYEKERELYQNGTFLNVGTSGGHAAAVFNDGFAGMTLQSSALWSNTKDRVHFGVTAVPWPINNPEKGGFVTGGNSLWVLGKDAKSRIAEASWEFVRFMSSTESQSYVFQESGYLPNNKPAFDYLKDRVDPVRKVMLKSLLDNKANVVTGGCHSGAFQAERELIIEALSKALTGGGDLKTELQLVKDQSQKAFKKYLHRAELQKKHRD